MNQWHPILVARRRDDAAGVFAIASLFFGLAVVAACVANCGCSAQQKPPCAAPIVATYTAEMIAAGCTRDHFNDAQCAPIKAERDAREKAGGCK